jgi:hypothetical protein
MENFTDSVKAQLLDAGLTDATLVISSAPEGQPFGDADAVFRVDRLLLRFVRDRGQAFLDIASNAAPTQFHQYDDFEIAMGLEDNRASLGQTRTRESWAFIDAIACQSGYAE